MSKTKAGLATKFSPIESEGERVVDRTVAAGVLQGAEDLADRQVHAAARLDVFKDDHAAIFEHRVDLPAHGRVAVTAHIFTIAHLPSSGADLRERARRTLEELRASRWRRSPSPGRPNGSPPIITPGSAPCWSRRPPSSREARRRPAGD